MIMNQKKVLDPYRTLGCFVHGPVALSESTPYSFAIASYNSFKVYSHELAIKVVSPCFLKPITAIATYNEYTYVRTGESLIKMRYHHIVDEWKVALSKAKLQKGNKSSMLRFDEIIIVG